MDTKLSRLQQEWLSHVAATRFDPYRTMAKSAISLDDVEAFERLEKILSPEGEIEAALTKTVIDILNSIPTLVKDMTGKEFTITIAVPASTSLETKLQTSEVPETEYLPTKDLVKKLKESYKHVAEQFEFSFVGGVYPSV
jgi:ferritin